MIGDCPRTLRPRLRRGGIRERPPVDIGGVGSRGVAVAVVGNGEV
jgi:hypothetical protein